MAFMLPSHRSGEGREGDSRKDASFACNTLVRNQQRKKGGGM